MFALDDYPVWLFDLDGTLINSEPTHYQAYLAACATFSLTPSCTFQQYQIAVQKNRHAHLLAQERPDLWPAIVQKKEHLLLHAITHHPPSFLPGAADLLTHCPATTAIVTNATHTFLSLLATTHPLLKKPYWITREAYTDAKPAPDAYLAAQQLFDKQPTVAFEDTEKGWQSMVQAGITRPIYVGASPNFSCESIPSLDQLSYTRR